MKLFTSLSLFLLLTIFSVKGSTQILMDENFPYSAGDSLGANGWVSFSGGATNYLRVTAPGLTYAGYPLSGIGNATTVVNTGQDAYRQFEQDSTNTLYISYMLRVDTARTGDYFAALLPNNSTSFFTARMFVKDTVGGFKIGLSKSSGTVTYTSAVYSLNTTYLIVVKTQFNPIAQDDAYSMFVFSSGFPSTEPVTPQIGPITAASADNPIGRFALRQGTAASSPNLVVDGIRAGQTWADLIATFTCTYNWSTQVSGTTTEFNSVKAVNSSVVWAVGNTATIRKTTDGGATWTNGNPNPGVITGDIFNIEALDANTAWCTSSPTGNSFIYKTTNGGANWVLVHTQPNGFFNGIVFKDSLNGFVQGDPVPAGGRWSLFRTTNGGLNWDSTGMNLTAGSGTEAGWNNSVVNIGNTIWMGTNNTRVYKSTNFGSTWSFSATTGTIESYGVKFNDGSNGIAGGTNIVRSTDGGLTFTGIGTAPGTGNILGMDGSGTNFWYGRGTGIYRSSNNGSNFAQVFTISGNVKDLDLTASGNCLKGWAVTDNGTIAVMKDSLVTGVVNNNTGIANSYSLSQNYPNPFNPSTNISFTLPKAGSVVLKVYDVTGKEAAVLVNEFKQAGSYTVDFNASELSSGVYFYTIKAGDFVNTRKMLLLK